jgi:GAF domain-containing protein
MPEPESTHEVLLRVIHAVHEATSLEGGLQGVAHALTTPYAIMHASLWSHVAGADHLRVIGSWSLSESAFSAGVEVSTTITPPLVDLVERVHSGRMFVAEISARHSSMLDALMRREGVLALAGVPISHERDAVLILALGSSASRGFDVAPHSLLTAIGSSAASRLLKLSTTTP